MATHSLHAELSSKRCPGPRFVDRAALHSFGQYPEQLTAAGLDVAAYMYNVQVAVMELVPGAVAIIPKVWRLGGDR